MSTSVPLTKQRDNAVDWALVHIALLSLRQRWALLASVSWRLCDTPTAPLLSSTARSGAGVPHTPHADNAIDRARLIVATLGTHQIRASDATVRCTLRLSPRARLSTATAALGALGPRTP